MRSKHGFNMNSSTALNMWELNQSTSKICGIRTVNVNGFANCN